MLPRSARPNTWLNLGAQPPPISNASAVWPRNGRQRPIRPHISNPKRRVLGLYPKSRQDSNLGSPGIGGAVGVNHPDSSRKIVSRASAAMKVLAVGTNHGFVASNKIAE